LKNENPKPLKIGCLFSSFSLLPEQRFSKFEKFGKSNALAKTGMPHPASFTD